MVTVIPLKELVLVVSQDIKVKDVRKVRTLQIFVKNVMNVQWSIRIIMRILFISNTYDSRSDIVNSVNNRGMLQSTLEDDAYKMRHSKI